MRWIFLAFAVLFVVAQVVRIQPSRRDKQLLLLRQAATRAGLAVRFWTARSGGYNNRQLPASGFMYYIPWNVKEPAPLSWSVWMQANGEIQNVVGNPPALAHQWLTAFRNTHVDAWALLECNATGLGVLWKEQGEPEGVQQIADALHLLRQNISVVSG